MQVTQFVSQLALVAWVATVCCSLSALSWPLLMWSWLLCIANSPRYALWVLNQEGFLFPLFGPSALAS